uniref:Uncharacterized protein n=1 Tax=Arundo donax TaxID=35708 RepID=A0A0A9AJ12_ARUDO
MLPGLPVRAAAQCDLVRWSEQPHATPPLPSASSPASQPRPSKA